MKRVPVVLLVLLLAPTLLAACSSGGGHYVGSATGPRVGIVGDSITNVIKGDLPGTVGAKYRYLVKARDGKRIDQQLGAIRSILGADDPPARMIVNLGTNDALQHRTDALAHFADEAKLLENVPCVILVTITPDADYGRGKVAEQLNDAMHQAVASHPNFHLLDWAAMLAQDDHGHTWLSQKDAIHPNPQGAQVLAAAYRNALDQFCASAPASS